ncbi:MAG: hypothetical protein KF760_14025 [Candidatus Eremiobacteraeota bacterium]|nr:hypothetical protein [Candidatus Eremiobacteraeota bacterium]
MFALLSFALYQLSPNDARTALRDKTMTEAHFACTASIRDIKEWISAVSKPESNKARIEYLGDDFAARTVKAGVTSYSSLHNDPFSVPDDPKYTYVQGSLGALKCPYGHFGGKTGVDFLGLKAGVNLTPDDFAYMSAQQDNWLALSSRAPLKLGDYEVYAYVLPSANTLGMLTGKSPPGLRTYLVTTIAYRDGQPVMRARCLLKEKSAADYAYRANVGGKDILGKPVSWNVKNADTVLFDGPVHTNEVPYVTVPPSYWNAALSYYSWDTVDRKHPKRAFMGTLTFSGNDPTLTTNFDGVGWFGGNIQGSSYDYLPYDSTGAPVASTAQGSNPNPESGKINNRYDRIIEGGRASISKVASVPLPAELSSLEEGAFGSDTVTGLNHLNAEVSPTQKNGSLQQVDVEVPAYLDKNGKTVKAKTYKNSSDYGIFVNPKSGSTEAAGGVVVKGDVRNMYLEVTDKDGKLVTDTGLLTGSDTTIGNPTVRVQATTTSYDFDSGTPIKSYKQGPDKVAPDEWKPGTPDTWDPGSPAVPGFTTPGTPAHTQYGTPGKTIKGTPGKTIKGTAGKTIKGKSPSHSIPGCPNPTYHPPSGSGSSEGTYTCPHSDPDTWQEGTPDKWDPGTPDTWDPGTPDKWIAATPDTWTPPKPAVPGKTIPGTPGKTIPGKVTKTWEEDTSANLKTPYEYKAQDWVVDVKNVATKIPSKIDLTAAPDQASAWKNGVGTEISSSNNYTKTAVLPGDNGDGGVTRIYRHDSPNDTVGTLVTDPNGEEIDVGHILVYKQSRSDANRVDVFVLKRPDVPLTQQAGGLNGAVYGTGDISGLRGVNMDPKTIGVSYGKDKNGKLDPTTQKGISIADNVWQFGTNKNTKPVTANHGLGLVAPKMNVQTDESVFKNKNLFIYATIIAGSSKQEGTSSNPYAGLEVSRGNNEDTTDWTKVATSTDDNAASRVVQIFGGLTEQQTKARLSGNKGWSQTMSFDVELSKKPPPFFPSSNLLIPLAYTQESVLGQ